MLFLPCTCTKSTLIKSNFCCDGILQRVYNLMTDCYIHCSCIFLFLFFIPVKIIQTYNMHSPRAMVLNLRIKSMLKTQFLSKVKYFKKLTYLTTEFRKLHYNDELVHAVKR
ncbi:hypothetical protein ACF0H5_007883 [Mactra antiquata]